MEDKPGPNVHYLNHGRLNAVPGGGGGGSGAIPYALRNNKSYFIEGKFKSYLTWKAS
jgi:hypothetical protein